MAYYLSLEAYQGPPDMLILMLKKRELDVYAIPVAEVISQYREYLYSRKEFDLELAGEFLLLGAELLTLKCRLLLSQPLAGEGEGLSASEAELEMKRRLDRYRLFLKAAADLQALLLTRAPTYGRSRDVEAVRMALEGFNPLEGVTLRDLAAAYAAARRRRPPPEPPFLAIARPVVSLAGQARKVLRALISRPAGLPFSSLCNSSSTRVEVSATLAALLELARRGRLRLEQKEPFGEIYVYRRER